MRAEWTGLRVCPPCLDPRPPQMTPPNVYPEGMPFFDARPPQDLGDRLTDDTYLVSMSGTLGLSVAGPPVYPSGQTSPIGALSPQDITVDPIIADIPLLPGQTEIEAQNILEDDITLRTGPVRARSVT